MHYGPTEPWIHESGLLVWCGANVLRLYRARGVGGRRRKEGGKGGKQERRTLKYNKQNLTKGVRKNSGC